MLPNSQPTFAPVTVRDPLGNVSRVTLPSRTPSLAELVTQAGLTPSQVVVRDTKGHPVTTDERFLELLGGRTVREKLSVTFNIAFHLHAG